MNPAFDRAGTREKAVYPIIVPFRHDVAGFPQVSRGIQQLLLANYIR